jgi:predicted nucleic acid-binding protein
MSKIFLDTNILVYATNDASVFHQQAQAALRRVAGETLFVSAQVLREYANVMTTHSALTRPVVARNIARFRAMTVLYDTPESLERWEQLREQFTVSGRNVYDCNIAATMLTNNVPHILTHNVQDFTRYKSLMTVLPMVMLP